MDMDMSGRHVPVTMLWRLELVLLSFIFSVFGSFVTLLLTQEASRVGNRTSRKWWILLAALSMGGCAVW